MAGHDHPPGSAEHSLERSAERSAERDEAAALLAEHGMSVTDDGKARARERLADVDRRMTAKRWKALRARLGRTRSAA